MDPSSSARNVTPEGVLTRDDIPPRDRIRKLSSRPVVDVAPARAYARELGCS
ncbi:hypothetical protein [Streptomyces sp. NPDC002221]|uniref:hypothetical protein n=1 Tax=Streptomyces sp. NPDC002221 TaxID=3364639 RepID=UPI00368C9E96